MKNFIIITTPKDNVVTPQVATAMKVYLETKGIPVTSVVEMNEKELVNVFSSDGEPAVEIPQAVVKSLEEIENIIIRMRKSGASNHDITNAIAVATIIDPRINENLDILRKYPRYVSPDVRIIINPIWQGHTNK